MGKLTDLSLTVTPYQLQDPRDKWLLPAPQNRRDFQQRPVNWSDLNSDSSVLAKIHHQTISNIVKNEALSSKTLWTWIWYDLIMKNVALSIFNQSIIDLGVFQCMDFGTQVLDRDMSACSPSKTAHMEQPGEVHPGKLLWLRYGLLNHSEP